MLNKVKDNESQIYFDRGCMSSCSSDYSCHTQEVESMIVTGEKARDRFIPSKIILRALMP